MYMLHSLSQLSTQRLIDTSTSRDISITALKLAAMSMSDSIGLDSLPMTPLHDDPFSDTCGWHFGSYAGRIFCVAAMDSKLRRVLQNQNQTQKLAPHHD
jgi:hypothetical protein